MPKQSQAFGPQYVGKWRLVDVALQLALETNFYGETDDSREVRFAHVRKTSLWILIKDFD